MSTSHPLAHQPDPESFVSCPYDPSHSVTAKRIQFHITKCRRNHPGEKKECCYNATHMINEQEWDFHVKICPDRGVVDNYIYAMSNKNSLVIELPPEPVVPPNEENWDDENCGTYEPALKTADKPIIHGLMGATRSERRKYRVQQRQKFRTLDRLSLKKMKVSSDATKDKPLLHLNSMPASYRENPSQFIKTRKASWFRKKNTSPGLFNP